MASVRLLTPEGDVDVDDLRTLSLGRDHGCDIVLDDPVALRRHARIVVTFLGVVIEDTSRNGVYVSHSKASTASGTAYFRSPPTLP